MKNILLIVIIVISIVHAVLFFYFRERKNHLLSYFQYHIIMLMILFVSIKYLMDKVPIYYTLFFLIFTILNIVRTVKWLINSNKTNFYFISLYLVESFFVIVTSYANLYGIFNNLFSKDALTLVDTMYYSITTITTTGYGDIYPTCSITKFIAASEMLIGYFYGAIVIAIIVSKFIEIANNEKKSQ
ncbi:hypothetical protein CPJCM30710_19810 [Clostridium polyendosporum]|uniref:Potassium channel domain-containing protein n=1 Tax=Clostridium polyendosporum TaxID=69208 RepID=A0A919RZB1_9CLOT|nr:ion channel [Clostridium polyendosporum]GIM29315.1 hypothetical protein CPJCM30710_19810 [Clostridium polyendosporum]